MQPKQKIDFTAKLQLIRRNRVMVRTVGWTPTKRSLLAHAMVTGASVRGGSALPFVGTLDVPLVPVLPEMVSAALIEHCYIPFQTF